MEDTVSVLIWEDAMDMTDWARLLLAGSVETEVEGRRWVWLKEEQSFIPAFRPHLVLL
jgi:hypothetical protein